MAIRQGAGHPLEGLLLVNKPSGVTSHDVVQMIRCKLAVRRIGHTGTLDPMAQGLLILLVGPATKSQHAFQTHEKTYDAVLQLGTQTDTGDAMGRPIRTAAIPRLDHAYLADVLASFKGSLSQTPPAYSAVKVRGRPAYWWARRHQPVLLSPREVSIADISLVKLDPGLGAITFCVHCSAGTYIRTLAESIAQRLGTVGHLTSLVRLRIGCWRLEDAHPLDRLAQSSPEMLSRQLLPIPTSSLVHR